MMMTMTRTTRTTGNGLGLRVRVRVRARPRPALPPPGDARDVNAFALDSNTAALRNEAEGSSAPRPCTTRA